MAKSSIYLLFIKAILELYDNLSIICEPGDTQIVDRGFRDVASAFEDLGFDVKMPAFLQKGAKQLDIEQANETRMTTKTRWVVESFHSQFKKWRFFSERISQDFLMNIDVLVRTLAATLNKYRPRLFDGKSTEDYALANKMLLMKNRTGNLEKLISNGDLSLRKNWKNIFDIVFEFDFPNLTFDFLREYTCGVYQIQQSSSYAKAHLYDHDREFEFQLSSSHDSILRCRLHFYVQHVHESNEYENKKEKKFNLSITERSRNSSCYRNEQFSHKTGCSCSLVTPSVRYMWTEQEKILIGQRNQ